MIFTHSFRLGVAAILCATAFLVSSTARAEGGFSSEVSKSDYEAAGLKKLSSAERARLDALVKAYADGSYAKETPPGVPTASAAPTPAPVAVVAPEAATSETSTTTTPAPTPKPKKQKVKVDPGTEIEYNTMDSELVGTFEGFEKGTIITLANGQRWKVVDGSYVCGPDPRVKKVHVKPGVLGSFFLEFEKVGVRAKVQLIK